ncbi:MAG: DUF72 domain-containing protein [Verrucomicrobiales bacterium]|nr:DUF72 domain-containing protein [Verrucomicrobiales bacterium]
MPFDRERLRQHAAALAARGVFLGTSSWKYEGWLGQLYTPERYAWRGRVATSRFQRECLREYAEVFKTVCVDAAYYDFPRAESLQRLADAVPEDFQFGFKVTDAITIKKFPNLDRFGDRAGKPNPDFLNADLFATAFLHPCETIRPRVGVLIFEFSRFWPSDYAQGREFVAELESFLAKLPAVWPYAVELRNRHWLRPEYFACLARHRVAHVFNSWEAMPPVSEQMALPGSRTHPELVVARFLLRPGRRYEEAVKMFEPYASVKDPNPEARAAGAALIAEGLAANAGADQSGGARRRTFIFVNNRMEGNALETIEAMIAAVDPERLASGVQARW